MTPIPPPAALLVLDSGAFAAAFNMALDEALLISASDRDHTVLRFYGWTEPAATFGYFQRLAEVERATLLRPLIRRPTGGGIVPHDRDWTYSLAVPPGHPWHHLRATESYRAIHAWVVNAFARLGVVAELAPCCRKEAPGQCFLGWEAFDVLWGGRKIGGAAQRRNRLGLLIQGSIQPPPCSDRDAWQSAMLDTAADAGFNEVKEMPADPDLGETARHLVDTRYAQASYNGAR